MRMVQGLHPRYELWFAPIDGRARLLGRFDRPEQQDEMLRRARRYLDARASVLGFIEVYAVHRDSTIHREGYPS